MPADQKSFSVDVKVAEVVYYAPEYQPIIWLLGVTQDAIQAMNFTNQGFKVQIKGDYAENLLSEMLNNDDLSDEL